MVIGEKNADRKSEIAQGRAPYTGRYRDHQHVFGGVCDGKYRHRRCLSCGETVYSRGLRLGPETDATTVPTDYYAAWMRDVGRILAWPAQVRAWGRRLYALTLRTLTPTGRSSKEGGKSATGDGSSIGEMKNVEG